MPSELKITSPSTDVTVAAYRNVLFVHFRGATEASCCGPISAAFEQLAAREKGIVFFAVIEEASAKPGDAARKAFAQFFQGAGERMGGAVVAYKGDTFRASMVRTVTSVILNLMSRTPFPKQTVASVDEAAKAAAKLSPGLDAAAVRRAFDELLAAEKSAAA
jgi:hypothetical protein